MTYIISASKRTDIPAFYADWLVERIKEGYALYRNPFNKGQVIKVSLRPEDVISLVLWTRNPKPMLKHLDYLDDSGLNFYWHFTINNYPRFLDESTPSINQSIELFRTLSDRYSPSHLQWRYDPIVFTSETPFQWHLENFEMLCKKLEGYTTRCYFSFVDFYKKTVRHIKSVEEKVGVRFDTREQTLEQMDTMTMALCEIAGKYRIKMYGCAEPNVDHIIENSNIENLNKAHCVDFELVQQLFKDVEAKVSKSPTRDKCGCFSSRDLGAYDSCLYKCIYCYANADFDRLSKARIHSHDSESEFQIDEPITETSFTDLTPKKPKGGIQGSLF